MNKRRTSFQAFENFNLINQSQATEVSSTFVTVGPYGDGQLRMFQKHQDYIFMSFLLASLSTNNEGEEIMEEIKRI